MRRINREKINDKRFVLLFVSMIILLTACANSFNGGGGGNDGDMGSFTVVLGGERISRSTIVYPPQTDEHYALLRFDVRFMNGSNTAASLNSENANDNRGNGKVGGTIQPGTYTVMVDVFVKADDSPFASGSLSGVQINSGPNPTITVPVRAAIHVSISPSAANRHATATQQFTVTVTVPASNINNGVTWSVSGGGANTSIDPNTGLLTVGGDEDLGTVLTIRATSVADTTKYGEAAVTVSLPTAEAPTFANNTPQGLTFYNVGATATALSITATVTDGGTPSYQWFRNTVNSITLGNPTPVGTNSNTYTPSDITNAAGTWYYWVEVTNTLPGHDDTMNRSQLAAVDVIVPVTGITLIPNDLTAIRGIDRTLNGNASSGGGESPTNQTILWTIETGATNTAGASILNGNILRTTSAGDVVITATINNGNASSPNGDYVQTFTITVSLPALTGTVNISGNAWEGQILTADTSGLNVSGGGNFSYQWRQGTDDIIGANGNTYTTVPGDLGHQISVVVGHDGYSGMIPSNAITVVPVVNAVAPIITGQPPASLPDYVIGLGQTAETLAVTYTFDFGTLSFQWYWNNTNSTDLSTANLVNDATFASYRPTTNLPAADHGGTRYYFVVVTNTIPDNGDGGNKTAATTSTTAAVTVIRPVTSISPLVITPPAPVKANSSVTLAGTVSPSNATNQNIVWSVESGPANISSGNTLNATAAGTVVIKATITNGLAVGTDYTQDFTINVQQGIGFTITYEQIINPDLQINSGIILSRSGTRSATLNATGSYSSIEWYLGNNLLGSGSSLMLDLDNYAIGLGYNIVRTHFLTVVAVRDGVPYSNTVSFTVTP